MSNYFGITGISTRVYPYSGEGYLNEFLEEYDGYILDIKPFTEDGFAYFLVIYKAKED